MDTRFDKRLEEVYRSLMIETTDTVGDTHEKDAAAIAGAHKRKSLARKAMDAFNNVPDGEITDLYNQLQDKRKEKLIPALTDKIKALDAKPEPPTG